MPARNSLEMDTETNENPFIEISNSQNDPKGKDDKADYKSTLNFPVKVIGYSINIYKPMVPIKLILFLWYGGGSYVSSFVTLYFKKSGITLSEISMALAITPVAQFLGASLSGIVSDKIGRSKPVLLTNVVLTAVFLAGILLVPSMESPQCKANPINLKCHPRQFDRLITRNSCDVVEEYIHVQHCNVQCPMNVTEFCDGKNLICEILAENEETRNFSLKIHVDGSYKYKDRCFYNVSSMSHKNETYSWCDVPHKMNCRVSCMVDFGLKCDQENSSRTLLLGINIVLFVLFLTTYSTTYRFLDITTMSLVKEHDSDFGRERVFAITGILIVSPIAGYIVDATTSNNIAGKNYMSAFYFYFAIVFALILVTFWLDVKKEPPGKKMWRKTAVLLKNPDVISFVLVVFVLGSTWCFTKNFLFWYLEELKAPSLLLGLIPSVASLYGLPFLMTSRWFVKKIGATQIFILAMLAYVVNNVGYSFLGDPWYSLILEATNIFTYHLLWVAVVIYSHDLAPKGLTSTVIAMAGSLHYQISKTSGSLIGGYVMNAFSGAVAFRVFAVICFVCAVIYSIYLFVRRRFCRTASENKDAEEKVENKADVSNNSSIVQS